jgi:hypothetical protein
MMQNNVSIMVNDRHAGSRQVARCSVVLLMTTSSLVRIIVGKLMAVAPSKPVHVWIVLTSSVASMLGQSLFTIDSTLCVFIAIVTVGGSDGCFWASLPIVSGSLFGLKNSGGIYGMVNCFGSVGFIVLSEGVYTSVYSHHSSAGARGCEAGVMCFRGFHIVCAVCSILGGCAALGLVYIVSKQRKRSVVSTLFRASAWVSLPHTSRATSGGVYHSV